MLLNGLLVRMDKLIYLHILDNQGSMTINQIERLQIEVVSGYMQYPTMLDDCFSLNEGSDDSGTWLVEVDI